MAKKVSVLDALAALESLGVSLSPEQVEAIETAKEKAMTDAAAKVFTNKLTDVDPKRSKMTQEEWVSEWVTRMFRLASDMRGVKSISRQQGRGSIVERMFAIETPHGKLKVSLTETDDSE